MKYSLLVVVFLFPVLVNAQEPATEQPVQVSPVSAGIGAGLDFGGIGLNLTAFPDKHFGLFGSVGFAVAGTGYNFGTRIRFNPDKKFCFTSGYMYGYNAALKIGGATDYNKLYYGSSVFIGDDIFFGQDRRNYLSIGLILPFRDPAFQNDIDTFRANGVTLNNPLPLAISVGFHVGL